MDVSFAAVDAAAVNAAFGVDDPGDVAIPIWTTTPWTLPANQAVSLHPDLTYVLLSHGDRRFVVAADLAEDCAARFGYTLPYTDRKSCVGKSVFKRQQRAWI